MEGSIPTDYGPVAYTRDPSQDASIRLEITTTLPARTYSRTTRSYTDLPAQTVKVVLSVDLDGENVWVTDQRGSTTEHVLADGKTVTIRRTTNKYLPPGVHADAVKALVDTVRDAWWSYAKAHPDIAKEMWRDRIRDAIHSRELDKKSIKALDELVDKKIRMAQEALVADNPYRAWIAVHRKVLCGIFSQEMAENEFAYMHMLRQGRRQTDDEDDTGLAPPRVAKASGEEDEDGA